MLRRLYDWCIAAADKPYAPWLMGAISFAESSFFPDPARHHADPDVAGAARTGPGSTRRCARVTSVAGGVLGYFIGAVLYDSVGQWLIQLYGYGDKVEAFREAYAQWGAWIILLKGVTPIPYKIVTITSGFAGYNLFLFIAASRSSRAACASTCSAFLLNRYGAQARAIIEERLDLLGDDRRRRAGRRHHRRALSVLTCHAQAFLNFAIGPRAGWQTASRLATGTAAIESRWPR